MDDLTEMRTLIRRALSARGYAVDVASSLTEARELGPAGYAAVLVDAHLGPEQGIDLIKDLEAEDPEAARRCMLMTGGSAGAVPDGIPILAKPFQLTELLSAVQALHGRSSAAAAGRRQDQETAVPPEPAPAGPEPASPAELAATDQRVWGLLELGRGLRVRERGELADFLHDGPIQELTAAGLELQLMAKATGQDSSRIESVLERLETAGRSLRWLVDGQWLLQVTETQLLAAMERRTTWLLAAPVVVDTDGQPGALSPAEVPAVTDVTELMLLSLIPVRPPVRARVTVRARDQLIEIGLILTPAGDGQRLDEAGTGQAGQARAALDRLASVLASPARAELGPRQWRAWITLRRPGGPGEREQPP
ncbi:MAG TPA: hypothetical protein VH637_24385 [Streptosporangiaceae bacterium]